MPMPLRSPLDPVRCQERQTTLCEAQARFLEQSPQTHVDRVASFCPLPIMSADMIRITTGQFTFRCVFRRLEILTACLWPRQVPGGGLDDPVPNRWFGYHAYDE